MKKYIILILILVSVISCSKKMEKSDLLVKLGLFAGDVTVERNSQSIPVALDMKLLPNDIITTGPNSSATLVFANIGISKIQEKSLILLKALFQDQTGDQIRLNLKKGTLLSSLKKLTKTTSHFEIETPTAVAGIRGTTFMVKVGPKNETRTSVFSGVVKVSTPQNTEKTLEVTEFKEIVVEEKVKEIEEVKVTPVTKIAFEELKSIADIPEIKDTSIEEVKQEIVNVTAKAEVKKEEILKYEEIKQPEKKKKEDSGLKW